MQIICPVSLGELVDKITILEIKVKKIDDQSKLILVQEELQKLQKTLQDLNLAGIAELLNELLVVNEMLWDIEDKIRDKERNRNFDNGFIELARDVYKINDQRFQLKKKINERYGSTLAEVKSYRPYN